MSIWHIRRARWTGRHFGDDILICILFNEKVWIAIKISLKSVPKVQLTPSLDQIMAWHRTGDKPLSESMIVYWHIYASLGLNELRILPSVQQHAYWIPRVTACLYQFVSEYHLLCRIQHFVKKFINYQMQWYLPFFRNMQIVFTFHKHLDIEFMFPMCVVSNYDVFTIHIFWKFDFFISWQTIQTWIMYGLKHLLSQLHLYWTLSLNWGN